MIMSIFFPVKRVNFIEFIISFIILSIFCLICLSSLLKSFEQGKLITSIIFLWGYVELYIFKTRDIGKSYIVYFFLANLIPSSFSWFICIYYEVSEFLIYFLIYAMLSTIAFYPFENEIYLRNLDKYIWIKYYNSNIKIHYSYLREVKKDNLEIDLNKDILVFIDYFGNAKAFYHEISIERSLNILEGRFYLVSKEKLKS